MTENLMGGREFGTSNTSIVHSMSIFDLLLYYSNSKPRRRLILMHSCFGHTLEIIAKIKKIEEEQRRKFEEDNPD